MVTISKLPPRLRSLGAKAVVADGEEQTLCQQGGGSPSEVSAYIDMSNMQTQTGDSITIRFYVKVKSDGEWRQYHQETYSDSQTLPLLYIPKRPENHGLKVTLQQVSGMMRSFDHEFFEEA